MRFQLLNKPLLDVKQEYIILPFFFFFKSEFNGIVKDFLEDNPKFGKKNEVQLLYSKSRKLLLVGLGKKEKLDFATIQNWAGTACKYLSKKTKTSALVLPETEKLSLQEVIQAVVIGAEVITHDPTKDYKSEHEPIKIQEFEILVNDSKSDYQKSISQGLVTAEAINLVRRLADMPANEMTPTYFLNEAKKVAKESERSSSSNKLKITILDEKQAKKKGMGAFCGVAQGSDEPSYMIALEHKGHSSSKDKWGLIGKGITFDTGGISLKPGEKMEDMKYDMCGAATVLASMQALSKLKIKQNVVGIMAVTENLPGGKAQRPGDIVRTYSGKTAEVINTDAEGRLVLIDAITFAQKDFKANKLIDLATLTGAMIIALGNNITGAFGNNPKFTQDLITKGSEVGEKFWEMPMDEEFNEMIKSEFADIINVGNPPRVAGSIVGAKFIEQGIEKDNPWIHLDIAGTAWDLKAKSFRGPGATGVGVKTLINLISA